MYADIWAQEASILLSEGGEINYLIQLQNLNRIKEHTILIYIYLHLDYTFSDPRELYGN